jgi:hypothetical protein
MLFRLLQLLNSCTPLAWRSPRHFVPGYDRIVPPGHFKQALARIIREARWLLLTFLIQASIQLESRADECHVGKSLRKISQMLAGGAELLRVKAQMIGIS